MKKIFSLCVAALAAITMTAQDIAVNIKLVAQSGGESTLLLASGTGVTSADNATLVAPLANTDNVAIYVQDDERYSIYATDGSFENLPIAFITDRMGAAAQSYTLHFEDVLAGTGTGSLTIKDLVTGAEQTIVDGESYGPFEVNTANAKNYVAGTNTVIGNRFVINYHAPSVQLFNEWDDNWATPLNFTDNNDGTFSATKTFTGNGYCPFKIVENGNWLGNGDAFKRDYTAATGIGDGANMTLWVDVPGDYTFTWDFMTNSLSITLPALPTVQLKGADTFWGQSDDFIVAADGLTASVTKHFGATDFYTFKVLVGADDWRSYGYDPAFTRSHTEQAWIGNEVNHMLINADQDGDYTFTWTYVENKLTITFPAVTPANTVTTNSYGFLSFASTESVEFLGGLKAYRGQYNAGTNELTLYEIGTQVPANTGVILWNSNGTAETFNYNTGVAAPTVSDNDFVGVTTAADPAGIRAAGKEIYCLNGNALKQYVGDDNIPAGKAYLPISVGGGSNNAPKRITMRFNGTTAVDNVEAESVKAEKFVENGQVLIRRGNEVYNLQGQIVK